MADPVLYETQDRVATLTLNRPDRLNTIVPEMMAAFDAAMRRALDDGQIRVIRLRGAGRSFCAGYDIDWGAEMMEQVPSPWDPIRDYQVMSGYVTSYMSLWRSPKPVIAQVHGFCVGGGTDFALCSDLIVCAEDCRIGYPPARVWGSPTTAMWMYRIGLERTKRLLLTGDPVDGRRAVDWGLASETVPEAVLDETTLALAQRVAQSAAQPAPHDEAARQPDLRADGTPHDAADRDAARRLRAPHAGGRGVHAQGDGGPRQDDHGPRRPVRRLRAGAALGGVNLSDSLSVNHQEEA